MIIDNRKETLLYFGKYCYGLCSIPNVKLKEKIRYYKGDCYVVPSKQSIHVMYQNKVLFLKDDIEGVGVLNLNPDLLPQENEILVRFKVENIMFVSQFQMIVKEAEVVDYMNEIEYILRKYPQHSKRLIDNYNKMLERLDKEASLELPF